MIRLAGLVSYFTSVRAPVNGIHRLDVQNRCFLANRGEHDAEIIARPDLLSVEEPFKSDREVAFAHHTRHRRRVAFV